MLYVKFLNWENGSEDKVLAAKPEDLSSILGSHMLFSGFHTYPVAQRHPHQNK